MNMNLTDESLKLLVYKYELTSQRIFVIHLLPKDFRLLRCRKMHLELSWINPFSYSLTIS